MKRYIYIIIGIVAVAVLAIAVIFYLRNRPSSSSSFFGFGSSGSLPIVGTQGNNSGQQTIASGTQSGVSPLNSTSSNTATQGGLVKAFGIAADGPVLDYFVDAKNNITAISPNGTVFTVSSGVSSILSTSTIGNIIAASFSYDGKKILVSSGDPGSPQTNIFDVASKLWISGPKGMQSPQWSPSNYQIAYLSQSASGILSLATIDASNIKRAPLILYSLHATDLAMQWIGNNQFVLADKPTATYTDSIWIFDSQKGTLTPIIYEGAGAESKWGNIGTSTLGVVFDNPSGNSSLKLVTPSGSTYHALTFLTLPPKCIFTKSVAGTAKSSSTPAYLYCGIPADPNTLSSAQLPDDYNMGSLFTSDMIARVDVSTGQEDSLWSDSSQNMDTTDPKFFNNALFFINRYDQKLYVLTLVSRVAQ